MKGLGVGIVGCGVISDVYLTNMPLFRGVHAIACSSSRIDNARATATRFGIEALTTDEMFQRSDIDIVVNLTPPEAHFAVSLAALQAGKHVFSEKPLCITLDECQELLRQAASRGLKVGCAPDTFLGAAGRLSRELVDNGKIGAVLSGTVFMMGRGPENWHPNPAFFYKPGAGPLFDRGPYYLAALVNLLGPIREVQARTTMGFTERRIGTPGPLQGSMIKVETPTHVSAHLTMHSGAELGFTMSYDVFAHSHAPIELYGSDGSLKVPEPIFFGGQVELNIGGASWESQNASSMPFGKPNYRAPSAAPESPLRANYRCLGLADMAHSITAGTAHRASGELATHVLDVMQSMLDAGVSGQRVQVTSSVERPQALSEDQALALCL